MLDIIQYDFWSAAYARFNSEHLERGLSEDLEDNSLAITHCILGILESLPLIGRIVAIFEYCIAILYYTLFPVWEPASTPPMENVRTPPNGTFKSFEDGNTYENDLTVDIDTLFPESIENIPRQYRIVTRENYVADLRVLINRIQNNDNTLAHQRRDYSIYNEEICKNPLQLIELSHLERHYLGTNHLRDLRRNLIYKKKRLIEQYNLKEKTIDQLSLLSRSLQAAGTMGDALNRKSILLNEFYGYLRSLQIHEPDQLRALKNIHVDIFYGRSCSNLFDAFMLTREGHMCVNDSFGPALNDFAGLLDLVHLENRLPDNSIEIPVPFYIHRFE